MSKLKIIYLYIFSTVGLVLVIIGGVSLINLGLKTLIFTKADSPVYYRGPIAPKVVVDENGQEKTVQSPTEEELKLQEEQDKAYRDSQRQRDAAQAVAMIIVGLPVYLYHWREVRRKDV